MTIEIRKEQSAIGRSAQLEPQNFGEVARLAEYVAASGLFAVKTKEQAMMVMLTGASLGLSPVAALRGVHVIQGKATLDATLVTALVQQHPDCEYWRLVENTNERCTIETKRRGHSAPVVRTWTMEDAKRAKLTGKDTWQSYPAAMLRARCTTDLARGVYGDALFGVYTQEELEPAPREHVQSAPREQARVEVVPASPDTVAAILSRIADAQTLDALQAISKDASKATAKGSPERATVTAALHARRAEIEGAPPPNGGGSPKPEASTQASARGEPITGEHSEAPAAWSENTWTAHINAIENAKHLANSFAKHLDEFLPDPLPFYRATCSRMADLGIAADKIEGLIKAAVDARQSKAA